MYIFLDLDIFASKQPFFYGSHGRLDMKASGAALDTNCLMDIEKGA